MTSSLFYVTVLLLHPFLTAHASSESNLLRSENVFGWQQNQKPSHRGRAHSSSSSSKRKSTSIGSPKSHTPLLLPSKSSIVPLKRSENVFGWQPRTKDITSAAATTRSKKMEKKTIINVSSSSSDNHSNTNFNISPPSIPKIQPRKKELWLPWPLGALRNDFYRFAEEHRQTTNDEYLTVPASNQQQQQHLRQYYGDGPYSQPHTQGPFHHGMNWASRMLRKGGDLLPLPIFHGNANNNNADNKDVPQPQPQPRYWIKDTTTSMATASAAMKKKNDITSGNDTANDGGSSSKNNGGNDKGFNDRGGQQLKDGQEQHQSWDQSMIVKYLKLQASVRLRQMGYVGSDFSVHLPPSSPTLLLLYMLPSKQDPLRRLVKLSLTGATMSWMHSEATKYRRFAPLPSMKKMNVRQPDLPPFLPEELIGEVDHVDRSETLGIEAVKSKDSSGGVPNSKSGDSNKNDDERPKPSKKEDQWDPFASFGGTVSSAIRSWSEDFNLGKKEKENRRLIETRLQLLALRESAANSSSSTSSSTTPTHPKSSTSGYALVTGASRGIGRALAVELARYGIPLILVARDIEKLKTVAKEIETYYNVPCCTIQADLAAPDCASRIHAATSEAGLKVDILVNNAGICTQGEMLDGEIDDSMQMIQVNVGSVVQLSQLYGRDMKKRRRGRILFVSSMSGALPGCPNVAVYAATKSFEKSLSSSLGREMERYGVGVTCLLPGAVKDTAFASRSDVEDAVCFHFPGYAKTPEHVAGEGIKAMMLGYPEVYPGLHNQLFIKFAVPLLPARLTTLAAEYAWSPLQWVDASLQRRGDTYQSWGRKMREEIMGETFTATKEILPMPPPSTSTSPWRFRRPVSSDLLPLPDTPDNTEESKKTTSQSSTPKIVDQATDNIVNENPGSTTGSKEVESVPSANVESLVDSEERIDTLQKEEDASLSKNTIEGNDDGSSVDTLSSESETDATSTIPDVSSLALPSPAPPPPAPTPLAIFGFFGKESSTPSNSSRDSQMGDNTSHTTDAAISIDREHTHKDANTDSLNGDVVVEPFTNPNANITWYPIMDEHEYDFRDRRLDYAGMTLPSNH